MPLAGHRGPVAGRPQHLGDGDAAVIEIAPVSVLAPVLGHVADARLVRVQAGQQRGAGGAAAARVVELREPQPAGRKLVEVGRGNFAPVAADVAEAHVVDEDHDDVRPRRGVGCPRRRGGKQQEEIARRLLSIVLGMMDLRLGTKKQLDTRSWFFPVCSFVPLFNQEWVFCGDISSVGFLPVPITHTKSLYLSILHFGNAFCSSWTPLSVTFVSTLVTPCIPNSPPLSLSDSRLDNPANARTPSSVICVPPRLR